MSYVTVEVEIDHGRIVPREPEGLPEKVRDVLPICRGNSRGTIRPTRVNWMPTSW